MKNSIMQMRQDTEADTRCVYTVLMGGHEKLCEQEVQQNSNIPFICLTDNTNLRSSTWTLRHIEPLFVADIPRSSRFPKICAHKFFPEFCSSLYIDNSVLLKRPPEDIFENLLDTQAFNMACLEHPWWRSILTEISTVVRMGFDDPVKCFEQLEHYLMAGWSDTNDLIAGTLLLRRHNEPDVIQCMERWFYHVLRYSRRDQLSFNFVASSLSFQFTQHPLKLEESPYHKWPVSEGRDTAKYVDGVMESIKPSVLKVAELTAQNATLQAELSRLEAVIQGMQESKAWPIATKMEALLLRRPLLSYCARKALILYRGLRYVKNALIGHLDYLRFRDSSQRLFPRLSFHRRKSQKGDTKGSGLLVVSATDKKMTIMAENLRLSCERVGYQVRIYDIDDVAVSPIQKGSFKPYVVRKALRSTRRNIAWIDADCLVIGQIDDALDGCDVAVTLRRQDESKDAFKQFSGYLNSGVIFFRNGPASRDFVDRWIAELPNCTFHFSDQEALNRLAAQATDMKTYDGIFNWQGIRVKILPTDTYNFFYFDEPCDNARVLHFKGDKRHLYDAYVRSYIGPQTGMSTPEPQ